MVKALSISAIDCLFQNSTLQHVQLAPRGAYGPQWRSIALEHIFRHACMILINLTKCHLIRPSSVGVWRHTVMAAHAKTKRMSTSCLNIEQNSIHNTGTLFVPKSKANFHLYLSMHLSSPFCNNFDQIMLCIVSYRL